ncbi:uncharacterized protein LOC18424284 isoform X2 [Amborella trichopoda]|uniref:uncharacterized protein LOC18424284 isoform X2 n=1 Tax=Amborella trichopoda TaxID=13333 RepID=UPI0005D2E023|nr:uncharacterized protein LOC18424284 isoform X2 [Amborella trichopoda]|eukprot:XP_011628958.1 uncharacterized protein LOC18424284 isoform X2 [Amborella trichopoda]
MAVALTSISHCSFPSTCRAPLLHITILNQDDGVHLFSSCTMNKLKFGIVGVREHKGFPSPKLLRSRRRRTLVYAVDQYSEKSFKHTVEVDRLIDKLREANSSQLQKLVVENVLAFNESFWIRLAARTETCKSDDDKKDYEELALSVMSIVDRLVRKTNEKIESATDILKEIIKPVIDEEEEISWPPRDPQSLILMEKELAAREQEGQLDEGFLSEVNAQLRQAKQDGDKPGLEAMLQKVLQLYAAKVLSKRSYSKKGGEIVRAELLLESVIKGRGILSATSFDGVPERYTVKNRRHCPSFSRTKFLMSYG